MEGLAPPLELLLSVKQAVEQGNSVKKGIQSYLIGEKNEFKEVVLQFLSLHEQGKSADHLLLQISSMHRRALLNLLTKSLNGFPIYSALLELESELIQACEEEIQQKIAKLPFLLMIPLLLLLFPSFLLLLFGPLLHNLFHSFGGG